MELIHPCKNVLEKSFADFCTRIGKTCLITVLSKVWELNFPWVLTAARYFDNLLFLLASMSQNQFLLPATKGPGRHLTLERSRGGEELLGLESEPSGSSSWVWASTRYAAFTEGGGRLLCGSSPTLTSCQPLSSLEGFPSGAAGEEPTCQYRRLKRCGFDPWVRKLSWRREWQPTPVLLPGKSHGQRSLAGYRPWSHKELDTAHHTHTVHLV